MKLRSLTFLLILFSILACGNSQTDAFERLNTEQFKSEIQADTILLIDVSTPEEFESGHIEGASNWDYYSEDFYEYFKKIEKGKFIYLYCGSGRRSSNAAEVLTDMGYHNIHDLKGGMEAWEKRE